jgi:hypothetical protein
MLKARRAKGSVGDKLTFGRLSGAYKKRGAKRLKSGGKKAGMVAGGGALAGGGAYGAYHAVKGE